MPARSKIRKETNAYATANDLQGYSNAWYNYFATQANNQQNADLQNAQLLQQWGYQTELQQLSFQNQLAAWDRSEQAYAQNLELIDYSAQLGQDQINLQLDQKLRELTFMQDDLDRGWFKTQHESAMAMHALEMEDTRSMQQFGDTSFQQSAAIKDKAADAKYEMLKASVKGNQEKGEAAASGRRGNTARKVTQSAATQAAIDKGKVSSDLYRASLSFKNAAASARTSRNTDLKDIVAKEESVQTLLGLAKEQYESDTTQLGMMLMDTYQQAEFDMKKLDLQVFAKQSELASNRMLPPRVPLDIPRPFKIPTPHLVKPVKPIHRNKYIGAGVSGPSQPGQSTASSIFSLGGMAMAGLAAVPGIGTGLAAGFGAVGGISTFLAGLF